MEEETCLVSVKDKMTGLHMSVQQLNLIITLIYNFDESADNDVTNSSVEYYDYALSK